MFDGQCRKICIGDKISSSAGRVQKVVQNVGVPTLNGVTAASVPPQIITSASPR